MCKNNPEATDISLNNCHTSPLLYLVHFIPSGMQVLFDGLAFEISVADSDCCIGVWFAFH